MNGKISLHVKSGLLLTLAACLSMAGVSRADTTVVDLGDGAQGASNVPVMLQFPVSRAGDGSYEATFRFRTADGSAVAGTDYSAVSGTFSFPAGSTKGVISIPISANTAAGPDLTFQLLADAATGLGPQPTFGAQQTFLLDQGASTSLATDLNGDGQPDLVITNYSNETVSILVNQTLPGSSILSFADEQVYPAGDRQPVAVDLNGDGKIDIAMGNSSYDGVSVLLNTTATGAATTTFESAVLFDMDFGAAPFSTATADFNGDGLSDLATPNANDSSVSIFLNATAAGSLVPSFAPFQRFSAGISTSSIAVADFNGDGKPDLVVSNMHDNTLSVLINTTDTGASTLTFSPQKVLDAGDDSRYVAASDMNRDGKADLVAANSSDRTISVLLNTTVLGSSIAAFSPQQVFPVESYVNWLSIADLNGDGSLDVFAAKSAGPTSPAIVLVNSTPPGAAMVSFSAFLPVPGTSPGDRISSADLNNDGQIDLIAVDYMGGKVAVSLNTTAAGTTHARFSAHQDFPAGDGTYSTEVADLNGDGKPEAIATNYLDGSVTVLMNATEPGAATSVFVALPSFATGLSPTSVVSTDVNGDGLRDLLVSSHYENSTAVLINNTAPGSGSATFATPIPFASGTGPLAMTATDINGDGRPDIVATSAATNEVAVLFNATPPGDSTPNFLAQQMFATGTNPTSLADADINGDGKADLIVANTNDSTVSVLLNLTVPGTATASFAASHQFAAVTPTAVLTTDINSDGKQDVILVNAGVSTYSVLINTTAPGAPVPMFASPQAFQSGSNAVAMDVADADGDGKPDLYVANGFDDEVSVFLNRTQPGSLVADFASSEVFATGASPAAIKGADLNNDGKPDLLVTNFIDDSVSVLLNTQFMVQISGSPATGTIVHDYLFSSGFE